MADRGLRSGGVLLFLCVTLLLAACGKGEPRPGEVLDEASRAGRAAASFPAADEDYFRDMDGGVALAPGEIKGRNTWIVWTGGNDRFWDTITDDQLRRARLPQDRLLAPRASASAAPTAGTISGWSTSPASRRRPAPIRSARPVARRAPRRLPARSLRERAEVPGRAIGAAHAAAATCLSAPTTATRTGIVGLRLFPNPDFDEAAAKKWDPRSTTPTRTTTTRKKLVRPYRVGMSCGFCHVGPSPTKPPADPENPKWENLSSNVGAQYFWVDRIFDWQADEPTSCSSCFHTSRPGTLDTSLVSTDNINNPRTMNAV